MKLARSGNHWCWTEVGDVQKGDYVTMWSDGVPARGVVVRVWKRAFKVDFSKYYVTFHDGERALRSLDLEVWARRVFEVRP